MNTILYASLSANGRVIFAEDVNYQAIPEVVTDFMQIAAATRNLIIGKKTFDLILSNPMAKQAFQGIEVIVISKQMNLPEGIAIASSPSQAIQYCADKGYNNALVIGGAQVYQSFLTERLINDVFLNLMPMVTARGGALLPTGASDLSLTLIQSKNITDSIVQLHYKIQ